MLEIQNANVFYGDSHVVREVNLCVPPGKVVCLMGRNGVGKTTLLKTVLGIIKAKSGKILFNGVDMTKDPPFSRVRRGIGYVPQGREILPNLTVRENLLIGRGAALFKGGDLPGEVFSLFPVLKSMLNRRGGDLSGGQQQQLAIARALVSRPKLLILDEPTEGIQPSIIQDIMNVIRKIKGEGTVSILLVEQFVSFVREVANDFFLMEKGSIVANGPIGSLTDDVVHRHLAV